MIDLRSDTATRPSEGMRAPLDRLATALDRLGDRPYRVAFSVGAAECRPDRRTTIEALMDEADRSMYAHKRRLRPTG